MYYDCSILHTTNDEDTILSALDADKYFLSVDVSASSLANRRSTHPSMWEEKGYYETEFQLLYAH